MDVSALFNMSYGLYVLSTKDTDGRLVGCVINTAVQTSSNPASISVSTNKENYTTEAILRSRKFTLSILSQKATMETIGLFGFWNSKEKDKFETIPFRLLDSGLPILTKDVCSYLECNVKESIDCYTHKLILADLVDAGRLESDPPMTYDYYHKVVKGIVPKKAATYVETEN